MKRAISILVIFSCVLYSNIASADESFGFLAIRCIPEFNYFDVSPIWASNVGEVLSRENERENLSKKYNIFEESKGGKYTCQLAEGTIVVEFKRTPPGSSGMCGGAPQTLISILLNGRLLVRDVPFNDGCFSASLTRISYQDFDLLLGLTPDF